MIIYFFINFFWVFAVNGYTMAWWIINGYLPFRPHISIRALHFWPEQFNDALLHDYVYLVKQPNWAAPLPKSFGHKTSPAFSLWRQETLLTSLGFTLRLLSKSQACACLLNVSAHVQCVRLIRLGVLKRAGYFLFARFYLLSRKASSVNSWA